MAVLLRLSIFVGYLRLIESAYTTATAKPCSYYCSYDCTVIITISIMRDWEYDEFLLVLVMASKEFTKCPLLSHSFSSRTGTQLGWQIVL